MEALTFVETATPRRMTWPEIKEAYPDQWVVLGALETDPVTRTIHTAVVRGWGRTRRESWAMANLADGEGGAHLFTGKLGNPRPW